MTRRLTCVALVWWFAVSGTYGIDVVGPFAARSDCEQVRAWAEKIYRDVARVAPCWEGPAR